MIPIQPDTRSRTRKELDELIAAEEKLPPLELPPDVKPIPMEKHLISRRGNPVALMGVVENGLVRPLDSRVHLPDQSRVIIVTQER